MQKIGTHWCTAATLSTRRFEHSTRGDPGVVGCCAWTGASLILGSGEIWMALHALGLQRDTGELGDSSKHGPDHSQCNVPVPGAIGVQEGGYVVVGNCLVSLATPLSRSL